jgi:eukaryotic-like serine/threonine-protein kinase
MTGKTIGKYRILAKLGRGGLGTVYKAVDETIGREVAVKVLDPQIVNTEVLKRFEAEAKTLATINHPEIATLHEIHHAASEVLMVMELVRGETLDQLLQRSGALPAARAAHLAAQVLGALDTAHAAGVVHRDLKPSNIMVTESGGVKILDFALARVAGADQMTAVGVMVGTPAYMSPERILGNEVDGRADVYSAGVLFYRLLTNKIPFEAASPTEMVEKQLSQMPTSARTHRPDLPEWCEGVLSRALAKAPSDRFQTAGAFRAALLEFIAGAANEQTGISRAVRSAPAVAATARATAAVDATIAASIGAVSSAPPFATGVEFTTTSVASVPALSPAEAPTLLVPAAVVAGAPTATSPAALAVTAIAPTLLSPNPAREHSPTGTTLVMKRNQFAIAAAVLAALALGVVALAFIVIQRPAPVVVGPTVEPAVPLLVEASPVVAGAVGLPPPIPSIPAPPLPAIADPPARSTPVEMPAPPPLPASGSVKPIGPADSPSPPSAASTAAPRAINAAPFTFEAKAVVADGTKYRERDATILIADGSVTVTQKGDKALHVVPVAELLGLTYSNSKQPLWSSPTGPAEAMTVEGGAFGFMKRDRNWLGLRTNESLLVLRVDDAAVSRVIAGLQDRTGLTVARLIGPK